MRQFQVIVTTARFLANQDAQMEIVLRAKQAGDPRFEFLNYGKTLYPFYRYLIRVIKSGRWVPPSEIPKPAEPAKEDSDAEDSDEDGGYLHPSLFASSATSSTVSTVSVESLK
jgi:hypothetical protein